MSWHTDYMAKTYDPNRYLSPAETAEARIDPDQEPHADWADGWGDK